MIDKNNKLEIKTLKVIHFEDFEIDPDDLHLLTSKISWGDAEFTLIAPGDMVLALTTLRRALEDGSEGLPEDEAKESVQHVTSVLLQLVDLMATDPTLFVALPG